MDYLTKRPLKGLVHTSDKIADRCYSVKFGPFKSAPRANPENDNAGKGRAC